MEIWKSIPGYEGFYEASDTGLIRSLDRVVDGRWGPKKLTEKILKPALKLGYGHVGLYKNGVRRQVAVHILIARTFIGPRPSKEMHVCHNDGDVLNCRALNLRYDTCKNNHKDKIRHGTLLRGERNPNSKLKDADVVAIRKLAASGVQKKTIAIQFSVARSLVSRIAARQVWRHI